MMSKVSFGTMIAGSKNVISVRLRTDCRMVRKRTNCNSPWLATGIGAGHAEQL